MAFLLTRLARREFSSTFTSNSTRMPVSISCPSNQSLELMQVPVISPGTFSLCHDLPDSCDDSAPDYCDMEHRSSALDCPDGCTDGGCEGNRSGLRLSLQFRFRYIPLYPQFNALRHSIQSSVMCFVRQCRFFFLFSYVCDPVCLPFPAACSATPLTDWSPSLAAYAMLWRLSRPSIAA